MRIIFVRHGDPNYEQDCLTSLGRVQAKAAAIRLLDEGIEAIYTSPMGRAVQTAEAAARLLRLPVVTLPFLHELDWGSADGTPTFADGHPWDIADQLAREGWDLTNPAWPEHPYFRNNRVRASAAYVAEETDRWLASLGYEREGVYYRCARHDDGQHTVAVFSHGGSSAAAIGRIFNLPFPYVCATLHLPFTGITIARLDRRPGSVSMPRLELASDGRHIRDLQAE